MPSLLPRVRFLLSVLAGWTVTSVTCFTASDNVEALEAFKLSLNLSSSDIQKLNWLGDDPCLNDWKGIDCTEDGSGLVKAMYLYGENLHGSLPTEIGLLTGMENLYLFSNQLRGTLPTEFGLMTNIKSLQLQQNWFTGSIPSELHRMTQLFTLQLQDNRFSGPLSPNIGNMSALQTLQLFGNSLSGSLPSELGLLANMNALFVQDNQFTGSIPAVLEDLSKLTSVSVYDNTELCGDPVRQSTLSTATSSFPSPESSTSSCTAASAFSSTSTFSTPLTSCFAFTASATSAPSTTESTPSPQATTAPRPRGELSGHSALSSGRPQATTAPAPGRAVWSLCSFQWCAPKPPQPPAPGASCLVTLLFPVVEPLPANFTVEVSNAMRAVMGYKGRGDVTDVMFIFFLSLNQTTKEPYHTVVNVEVVLPSYEKAKVYSRQVDNPGGVATFHAIPYFSTRSLEPAVYSINLYSDWHSELEKIIVVTDDDDAIFVKPLWLSDLLLSAIVITTFIGMAICFFDNMALVKYLFQLTYFPLINGRCIDSTSIQVHPSTAAQNKSADVSEVPVPSATSVSV
ncbi:hypothetical protein CYMTET_40877 [Cymbomonas tetramitiformis]|uniref:Leucine-rich repeat-containing N-terminal plant-type domain-containing protein n=1 Tax=Cymbomonas tetramitiformis TaxID=36881 RepID=A0AAE0F2S8_9CHLO|nr:hypothetical protein CYMTET_40877 [Cymbomonas tetramitiformis]